MGKKTLLHQDDGLVSTSVLDKQLADLELEVIGRFLTSKGQVLDVGCGHGRAGHYLGSEGFEVVGVDVDLDTLREARQLSGAHMEAAGFILADGRNLCFRDQSFDCVMSLASTLSEKHRIWMCRRDRVSLIREGVRVAKPGGLVIVNFVHRYWSLKGFVSFFRNYWMWISEKAAGKRSELGDYIEKIGRTPIRFHAFTIHEAKSLFPRKGVSLDVWKRGKGPFTDWFFIIAKKTV